MNEPDEVERNSYFSQMMNSTQTWEKLNKIKTLSLIQGNRNQIDKLH